MSELFQYLKPIIPWFAMGATGSFLRETAFLYMEIEKDKGISQKTKILFAFLPLWVLCGGLLGVAIKYIGRVSPDSVGFYVLLAGATWRKIITGSKMTLGILKSVIEKIDEKPSLAK